MTFKRYRRMSWCIQSFKWQFWRALDDFEGYWKATQYFAPISGAACWNDWVCLFDFLLISNSPRNMSLSSWLGLLQWNRRLPFQQLLSDLYTLACEIQFAGFSEKGTTVQLFVSFSAFQARQNIFKEPLLFLCLMTTVNISSRNYQHTHIKFKLTNFPPFFGHTSS